MKHEEQVQYAAFKQFCTDTIAEKTADIKEANDLIAVLKADIEKYAADAERLALEIKEHEELIAANTADVKAATKVRDTERAAYEKEHKDYSESIDALERAIEVLKKQDYDRPQASFAQISSLKNLNLIPTEAKKVIDLFLEQDQDEALALSAPEANAYEFQSKGIIEMLQKLLDKFIEERTMMERDEANKAHAFDMLKKDLEAQIEQDEAAVAEKTEEKATKLENKAKAESELADTIATRDDDQKYVDDLAATCAQKASDFESRQQLRAEEIVAIEKAIEIISSGAVAGNADKHLPSLMQTAASAFPQLRADMNLQAKVRMVSYLNRRAKQLKSRVLSTLAVRASDDPFQKIKKMIKDLIVRLMEEANEEAEHKGWCDTELSTNEQTRKEKTSAVETLHAEIDELESSLAKLTEDITDLTKAVAELDAAVATATNVREEEKAKNTVTIKDAQDAQTAVAQALSVLKEFYDKAAEATSFVQEPEIFDEPYKGMGSENGGVVGMIEVIQSDFARLESETSAAEAEAQKNTM